ncbi:Putative translation initiation inhibitor YoaB [Salmonella sp. NCTC 11881]|nr:Putative translation initiation inhibitor YoaB [Salmonella sp. NCTC 11881]
MSIVRIDAEDRWSDVVIYNNTLWYTGVPENLDADAFEQTANTLAQIDAVLEKQGSSKSRILDATIFLSDKADFAAMNKAWDAWGRRRPCAGTLYRTGRVDEPEI